MITIKYVLYVKYAFKSNIQRHVNFESVSLFLLKHNFSMSYDLPPQYTENTNITDTQHKAADVYLISRMSHYKSC